MSENHRKYLAALDLPEDASWDDVKKAYRRLIRIWHPDRARHHDAPGSEERAKNITLAYNALGAYYRQHGTMPPTAAPENSPSPKNQQTTAPTQTATPPNFSPASQGSPEQSRRKPSSTIHGARWAYSLPILFVVATALVIILSATPPDDPPQTALQESGAPAPTSHERPGSSYPQALEEFQGRTISAGNTVGEVYAIMGIPSSTAVNEWSYGRSTIYFKDGRVTHWREHPDHPLRAATPKTEVREPLRYFSIGSTMADVRRIQGIPDRESNGIWHYGSSRVYFHSGHVVRWEESPFNPLRTRH